MIKALIIDDNHSFIDSLKVLLNGINSITFTKSVANFQAAQDEMDKKFFDLVIVENNTEVSLAGIDFILDIIKSSEIYSHDNFILLGSKPKEFSEKAKAKKIIFFKKPLNVNDVRDYIIRLIENKVIQAQKEEAAEE